MSKLTAILLLWASVLGAQDAAPRATPDASVRSFKTYLDRAEVGSMCEFMAAPDTSGPLPRAQFESMQPSMEGLIALWRNASFSYLGTSIQSPGDGRKAVVRVRIQSLKQNVSFVLQKFGSEWFILDIGITFY